MKAKTLREICDCTDASRRAVQGYEKLGLVAPAGRNKYGHLLYDEPAEERIRLIRFYQKLGFSLKEIAVLIDASDSIRFRMLQNKIRELRKECERLEHLIIKASEMLKNLE